MIEYDFNRVSADARAGLTTTSFDVFDTFLLRACTTPQGVFERAFQLSAIARTYPGAAGSYVQHRIQAESRAREKAKEKTGSFEVTIAEIYAYFPFRLFGLDRNALPALVDAEFRAEIDLCRANREIVALYAESQQRGNRVGFISDTYWNEQQLGALLRCHQPDLTWDFLYTSCDIQTSKSEGLFARYLIEQGVSPSHAWHIGDNETADIKGARRHGIRARFYPQASEILGARLQRESSVFPIMCPNHPLYLDDGFRTLRRIVAARSAEHSPAFHLGMTILGPALAAFDRFIDDRTARLRKDGAKLAVAFLGRDGFLSHKVWHVMHSDTAPYLEISRRVSLIGSANTLEPLVDLFNKIGDDKLDAGAFHDILKVLPPEAVDFFDQHPDGKATGAELAKALPKLIDESQMTLAATAMRKALLAYLRLMIPDLDACTDLAVVDIGYCGSVQKSLRRIFDQEQMSIRLHGLYLSTHDDAFDDLDPDDTAEGFISDLVITPHVKRLFNRNATVLEQMCCSSEGSVRGYAGSKVLREPDARTSEQLALVADMQAGALAFTARARELASQYLLQPFLDIESSARWTAAILGALLLLPDDDELMMLGSFKHDLNLGSQAVVPMVDEEKVRNLIVARGLTATCMAHAPPMWLAGSMSMVSPSHGYFYLLFGANMLPADVFGDTRCGTVRIGLFCADGSDVMETVNCYRTGLGDMRIRIPVSRTMGVRTIAVPLASIAAEGLLHGVTVQTGKTLMKASMNIDVVRLHDGKVTTAGLDRSGRYYRANDENGCLVVSIDPPADQITIFSIALTSLTDDRIMTMRGASAADEHLAEILLRRSVPRDEHVSDRATMPTMLTRDASL